MQYALWQGEKCNAHGALELFNDPEHNYQAVSSNM